ADVVCPAAAALTDAAAQDQQVDQAAIGHVHVVPVIHPGADDDHRATAGLVRVLGELAGQADQLVGRHPGNGLLPGGGVGLELVVAGGAVIRAAAADRGSQAAVDAEVGGHQVEHRHRQHAAPVGQLHALG